jgi:hypothetical protein
MSSLDGTGTGHASFVPPFVGTRGADWRNRTCLVLPLVEN